MKKAWVVAVMGSVLFIACNNSADLQQKADTLENEVDSAGEKLLDSGRMKMNKLKEKVNETFRNEDSASK